MVTLRSPQPTDRNQLVRGFVSRWAARTEKLLGTNAFSLAEVPLKSSEVGDTRGLLPLLAWHADAVYRYAMGGRSLGVRFFPDAKALLGYGVNLGASQQSTSELLCFILESLEDVHKNMPSANAAAQRGCVELNAVALQFKSEMAQALARLAPETVAKPAAA